MAEKLTQEEVARRIKDTFEQNVELVSEYKGKREPITLRCNDCGKEWETRIGRVLLDTLAFSRARCVSR